MKRESHQINRSPDDLLKYLRFDDREIVFRWSNEWWDGPLDGTISCEGSRYWFELYCATDEPGNPYYYLVYPLTNAEADFADHWSNENENFRTAWVPLGNDPTTKDLPETQEIAARWKEHEKLLPYYSERNPVGWFVSGSNPDFYGVHVSGKDKRA